MANISLETSIISLQARGEDVRDAFIEACEKIAYEVLPDAEEEGCFLTVNSSGKWEAMPWT